ncbi:MAG: ParA family protein [Desulfotignum sp.]
MAIVLTICGQKGGTGKSVVAVNLAASLALYEKKVLLIDGDPSGCSTKWIGIHNAGQGHDLVSVFTGKTRFPDAILQTSLRWLDILPAGFGLFESALKLSDKVPNQIILRLLIQEDAPSDYEYIIIDAPSSYGFLSIMAMAAADWLIVPVCPVHGASADVHCLLTLIRYIRKNHKIPLKIGGFVCNRCNDPSAVDDIQRFAGPKKSFQTADLAYDTHIPWDSAVEKSIEKKMPLALYDIKSPAGSAFLNFAKEIHRIFT